MNAERLLAALEEIRDEYAEISLPASVQKLHASLQQYASAPDEPHAQEFKTKLASLKGVLLAAKSNEAPPSRREIFASIEAGSKIGRGLYDRIEKIVEKNDVVPAGALSEITALATEVADFQTKVTSLISNLEAIHVHADTLQPGESEIGVTIPRSLIDSDIGGLAKELERLNRHLKTIKEISGDETGNLKFKSFGTSEPHFNFECGVLCAQALSKIISWAVGLCEKIFSIRKLQLESQHLLGEKKAVQISKEYEAQIEDLVKVEVETKTKDFFQKIKIEASSKRSGTEIDARANELQKPTADALVYILNRINSGAVFEVGQGTPRETTVTDEASATATGKEKKSLADQIEVVKQINTDGRAATRLPKTNGPRVQLPLYADTEVDEPAD